MSEAAERSPSWFERVHRAGLPVLLLAVVIRVGVGLDARDAPFWSSPMVDEVAYMQMAEREMRGIEPDHGAYYMTPGYAWLLAVANRAGAQLPQIKWMQLFSGALTAWLLFLLGRAFFDDSRIGWLAAVGWSLLPSALLHELLALKTTVAITAAVGALWAMHRAGRGARWWWVGCGALAGAASLMRGEAALVFTVLLLGAIWRDREHWKGPAVALAVLGLLLMVPTSLNLSRGGGPVLLAYSGGVNFYIGNHPGADGSYLPLRVDRSDASVEEKDAVSLAERAEGRPLRAHEVSSHWAREGLRWWAEDPAAAVALTAKKAALLWSMWEGHDVLSPSLAGRWVVLLRDSWWRSGVGLALALVGLLLSWRRSELWPLRWYLLASWLALIPFFVFERFRLGMVAVGLLFAAQTLVYSYDRLRRRQIAHALAPLLAAVLLGGVLAQVSVARNESVLHVNVGGMLLQQERYEEALREFLIVRRSVPDAKRVEINIATALHGLGRDDEALRSLRLVRAYLQTEMERTGRRPTEELVYVHVLSGDILEAAGDIAGARSEYRAAWTLRPGHPEIEKKLSKVGSSPPGP